MYYWDDMFREMEGLRRDVERAVGFANGGRGRRPYSRFSFLPGLRARAYPLVNIHEDENAYYIEALAPGIDPESLDVTFTEGKLTLSGEKKGPGDVNAEAWHRSERAAGRFVRSMSIPGQVDADKCKAEYMNGLALITLPKSESAKPRQISVNVS